jgi:protein-L-isoaspartate O-methyltransferase
MLRILNVKDGHRVLEIGTGTGYNTALLCHRLGDEAVTTVDIDPVLVAEAQAHLEQVGLRPLAVSGDGADGVPTAAPYDRILSTCSAAAVWDAWIDQLAEDGLLVAPLTFGGALAVLRKTGPGELSGRLDANQAYFMPLHAAGEAMPEGFVPLQPLPAAQSAGYGTTTAANLAAWADPDWRLRASLTRGR